MMVAFWVILTGYTNSVQAATKLKSPYVVDHSHVLNESDVNFIDDVNKTVLGRVRTHPHIYVYITGSLRDASRSQSSYNGGSDASEEGVNRRKNGSKNTIEKYTDGRKLNGQFVHYSVRELRVKAHQKFTQLHLRENDVLLYCSLVDRQIVYYRGNDLRVVFPANRFDVVYTRGCQHDLNAGNFENGIISTVKNTSNHIQENSIRIGAKHNYDRIKKLCMYWGITIGIFLVVSLVIWQRKRLDAWFNCQPTSE